MARTANTRVHHTVAEWARDFDLELPEGGGVRVLAGEAWLIGPQPTSEPVDRDLLSALWDIPGAAERLPRKDEITRAATGRFDLEAGAEISVVAGVTRIVDKSAGERLPRQEPWRRALIAGESAPLVIRVEKTKADAAT